MFPGLVQLPKNPAAFISFIPFIGSSVLGIGPVTSPEHKRYISKI